MLVEKTNTKVLKTFLELLLADDYQPRLNEDATEKDTCQRHELCLTVIAF